MIHVIFMTVAAICNITAIVLLFKDCYRGYGSTMGGEMMAGLLWVTGSLLWIAGTYAGSEDRLLSFAAGLSALLLWIPCRWLIVRLGLKRGKPAPKRQMSEPE